MKCWACLRITPAKVLKLAHKVWKNEPDVARKIGLEASKIVEDSYQQKQFFCSGRPAVSLLCGLFYLLGFRHKSPKTQREIAYSIQCNEVTLRNSYLLWIKNFPETFKEFKIEHHHLLWDTEEGTPFLTFNGKEVSLIHWRKKLPHTSVKDKKMMNRGKLNES